MENVACHNGIELCDRMVDLCYGDLAKSYAEITKEIDREAALRPEAKRLNWQQKMLNEAKDCLKDRIVEAYLMEHGYGAKRD